MLFKVVRFYLDSNRRRRTVKSGLGQAHCRDPESSSRTATSAVARRRTRERGPWFDGYEADK